MKYLCKNCGAESHAINLEAIILFEKLCDACFNQKNYGKAVCQNCHKSFTRHHHSEKCCSRYCKDENKRKVSLMIYHRNKQKAS